MTTTDDPRQGAIRRLNAKREFRVHLGIFILVNGMLVTIWALAGAGFFWPIWPIGGWGIGLASHAFSVYGHRSFTEDEIRSEMQRLTSPDASGR